MSGEKLTPGDFLIVKDDPVLANEQLVLFRTKIMPPDVAKAFSLWKHQTYYKSDDDWERKAQEAAEIFTSAMGFSPEKLLEAKIQKERELNIK